MCPWPAGPGLSGPHGVPTSVFPLSELFCLGLSQHFIAQLEGDALFGAFDPHAPILPARVSFVSRNRGRVLVGSGAAVPVLLPARLCDPADPVVVGDWLVVDRSGDPVVGLHRLDRRTVLRRRSPAGGTQPVAANVDVALICMAIGADFSVRRAERWLAVCHEAGVEPLIVVTKADPDRSSELEAARRALVVLGAVDVMAVSALHGTGVDALLQRLSTSAGTTASLLGSSGVGKSTLLNALLGDSVQATSDVRQGDDKGRHTTTSRSLFRLPGDVLLVDNPGVREVGLVASGGLDAVFADIDAVLGSCLYRDCRHEGDAGCALDAAVEAGTLSAERVAAWQKLQREAAYEARRTDRSAQLAEQRKWRRITQDYRQRVKHDPTKRR